MWVRKKKCGEKNTTLDKKIIRVLVLTLLLTSSMILDLTHGRNDSSQCYIIL